MATDDIVDILQLINSENVGPVTFYKLLKKFGSAKRALEEAMAVTKIRLFSRDEVFRILEETAKKDIAVISFQDTLYPQRLLGLSDAPPVLFVRGNLKLLNAPASLSIVGARNASINGRKTASRIAYDLTNQNVVIISGMARGIDAAAHKGSLYAFNQQGPTIAVLGTGVDVPYPDENQSLYEQIVEQGCVISEFLPGTLPQALNFPRRNKIVAALSLGTLVVEATLKSGSLITAKLAAEYGRKLFAVPGAPTDARSLGPNQLIKNGAGLVETAQDIIKVLHTPSQPILQLKNPPKQQELRFETVRPAQTLSSQKTKIIDYLNSDGVYVDEIIRASGMSASEVALELLDLEMSGKIERQSGNKVALIKRK